MEQDASLEPRLAITWLKTVILEDILIPDLDASGHKRVSDVAEAVL